MVGKDCQLKRGLNYLVYISRKEKLAEHADRQEVLFSFRAF